MSARSRRWRAVLRRQWDEELARNAERGEFPMGEPFQSWKAFYGVKSGPRQTAPGPNAKRNRAKRMRRAAARRA